MRVKLDELIEEVAKRFTALGATLVAPKRQAAGRAKPSGRIRGRAGHRTRTFALAVELLRDVHAVSLRPLGVVSFERVYIKRWRNRTVARCAHRVGVFACSLVGRKKE